MEQLNNKTMNNPIDNIKKHFQISEIEEQRGDLFFVSIDREETISLVTYLRDYEGFSHFVLLTAVDWIEEGEFQLTYLLNHPEKKLDLGVRTRIDRENATMESAHHLWEHVATYQRELKEMFGIDFPGSPRLDEEFMLEGWDDVPPMRREFDTKQYSEDTYFPRPGRETNDPAEHMKKKLYPDEKE
jgi:NADH-quinone oxidoreductase subunit C